MKNIRFHFVLMITGICCLAACSSTPPAAKSYASKSASIRYQGDSQQRISSHFKNWQGTPHKMGGLSKDGIDCSGFVFVTYRDVFGMRLPRSTDMLDDIGSEISLEQAKLGDLLIFKTGFKQKHVGIYMGNGQFIHASSSQGVVRSNVRSDYWADAYRQTRRVLF